MLSAMRMTPLARLIETKLGQPLVEYVRASRSIGQGWRAIATEIEQRTGVEVSHETLRFWCQHDVD